MGAALWELNHKLSWEEFLNQPDGVYLPVIIFVSSCGAAYGYREELQELLENKWFRHATKIGFAIEASDENLAMLSNIVEYDGTVFRYLNSNDNDYSEVFKSTVVCLSQITSPHLVWIDGDVSWLAEFRESGSIQKEMFISRDRIIKASDAIDEIRNAIELSPDPHYDSRDDDDDWDW